MAGEIISERRAKAAFPANVLFPIVVVAIVSLQLNPNIWLSR